MVCVCGFRYVPEIAYQDNVGQNYATPQSGEIEDPVTKRNLAAIKGSYLFFAAVIALTAVATRSPRFLISYVIPTAITGFYIYKYKPKKAQPSHDQAINDNPMDIANIVASDPKFYGNLTKGELGILAVFTIIIPVAVSYFISKDTEVFLGLAFVLGFGGSMFSVLTIIIKRSLFR